MGDVYHMLCYTTSGEHGYRMRDLGKYWFALLLSSFSPLS